MTQLVDEAVVPPEGERADGPGDVRLWLKCVLGDQRTGEVLVDWDVERLPSGLRVAQLPSFLVQRFGPSLDRWDGQTAGAAFQLPEGLGIAPAGTALAVIPLISNGEDDAQPVAERLREIERQFGDVSAGILERLRLDQLWVGPLVDPDAVQQPLNDSAARACRAWLAGLGLIRLVEGMANGEIQTLPHPGLDEISDVLEKAVRATSRRVDAGLALCLALRQRAALEDLPAIEDGMASIAQVQAEEKDLVRHHLAARIAVREAERAARTLAQLALGVSAASTGGQLELVDRSAVAVLMPPEGHGPAAALVEDGVSIRSATREDLEVELAGILCRLLVEGRQRARLWAAVDQPAILVDAAPGNTLIVSFDDDLPDELRPALAQAGWSAAKTPGRTLRRRWSAPVSLMIPAGLIARTLCDALRLSHPARLRVQVERVAD